MPSAEGTPHALAEVDLEMEGEKVAQSEAAAASAAAASAAGGDASEQLAAQRFMATMSQVGATLGTLKADDAAAGFKSLSVSEKETALVRWNGFKEHAGSIDRTNGWRGVRDTASVGELANLPSAAAHGLLALMFVVLFAAVFVPAKYVPPLKEKCAAKLEQWEVKAKLQNFKETATTKLGAIGIGGNHVEHIPYCGHRFGHTKNTFKSN